MAVVLVGWGGVRSRFRGRLGADHMLVGAFTGLAGGDPQNCALRLML